MIIKGSNENEKQAGGKIHGICMLPIFEDTDKKDHMQTGERKAKNQRQRKRKTDILIVAYNL